MKVLRTCQDIQKIPDDPWLAKSFSNSRLCFSRFFLIKTDRDYRIISANLLDRIVAFCKSIFGKTYESHFASTMQVGSVTILDRKEYEKDIQKVKEKGQQILAPVIPQPDYEAIDKQARKEARRDYQKFALRNDPDWLKLFTDEQRACGNKAIEAIYLSQSSLGVALEVDLTGVARKEVMDFLVSKKIIAGWAYGNGNRILVKDCGGDPVYMQVIPEMVWRTIETLEADKRFQKHKKIGFFHQEQLDALQRSHLDKKEILQLFKIIQELNKRGWNGYHLLANTALETEKCLQFLKDQHMIQAFKQEQGKWFVQVTSMDDLNNQQPLIVPVGFLEKQKNAMDIVLGRLAEKKAQNYPRAYAIDLQNMTKEQTRQVMDNLLLQGKIVGWHQKNKFVDVTADSSDLQKLPPADGSWRTLADAKKYQEMIDAIQIELYSKHFDALERSDMNRDQVIAMIGTIGKLNQHEHQFTSQTGAETAGLEFLKNQQLIRDFVQRRSQDIPQQIEYAITYLI